MFISVFFSKTINRIRTLNGFYSIYFQQPIRYKPIGIHRLHIGHRITLYKNSNSARKYVKKINLLQKSRLLSNYKISITLFIRVIDFVSYAVNYLKSNKIYSIEELPAEVLVYTNGIHSLFIIDEDFKSIKIKFFDQKRYLNALDSIDLMDKHFSTGYISSDMDNKIIEVEFFEEYVFEVYNKSYAERMIRIIKDLFDYCEVTYFNSKDYKTVELSEIALIKYLIKNDFTIGNILFTEDGYHIIDFNGSSYQSPLFIVFDLILNSSLENRYKYELLIELFRDVLPTYPPGLFISKGELQFLQIKEAFLNHKLSLFIYNYSFKHNDLYHSTVNYKKRLYDTFQSIESYKL